MVLSHPWVIGELALANLSSRSDVLRLLQGLPRAVVASAEEVLTLISHEGLAGTGIGYGDAQLVAATRLTPGTRLWTEERRLVSVAERLAVKFESERERPWAGGRP